LLIGKGSVVSIDELDNHSKNAHDHFRKEKAHHKSIDNLKLQDIQIEMKSLFEQTNKDQIRFDFVPSVHPVEPIQNLPIFDGYFFHFGCTYVSSSLKALNNHFKTNHQTPMAVTESQAILNRCKMQRGFNEKWIRVNSIDLNAHSDAAEVDKQILILSAAAQSKS